MPQGGHSLYCLMMIGIYCQRILPIGTVQETVTLHPDGVNSLDLHRLLRSMVHQWMLYLRRHILNQRTAEIDVDTLDAAADPKDGHPLFNSHLQGRKISLVPLGIRLLSAVHLFVIQRRIDVQAARNQDGVAFSYFFRVHGQYDIESLLADCLDIVHDAVTIHIFNNCCAHMFTPFNSFHSTFQPKQWTDWKCKL